MRRQEVESAINDFRLAFRDDLGCPFHYGRLVQTKSGGFSIDTKQSTVSWISQTSKKQPLYCTITTGTKEELMESGLKQDSKGIITCIYEDILDIQPEDANMKKFINKKIILDDVVKVFLNGETIVYRIIDYAPAFQLKDTFIFLKFGVVDVLTEDFANG
jgi:hypothetical protein